MPGTPAVFDCEVLSLDVAEVTHAGEEGVVQRLPDQVDC